MSARDNLAARPPREEMLPFSRPSISNDEIEEIVHSLKSGWITTGPKCHRFEKDVKEYVGAKHAVALTSATAGIHLALLAHGIGPGDEVVTTSLTFASTANMIVRVGATPVFVEIGDDMNIDPGAIEAAVTGKTKAIMPVHYTGASCDMDRINEIARRRGLTVIEDAAHAIGTVYKGTRIGETGNTTIFSFHPIKNITTAEGGMVVTNDLEIERKVKLLKFHGIQRDAWKRYGGKEIPQYEILLPGFKYNLTDIQAAMGIHQLRKLDAFIETRRRYAGLYNELLEGVDGIVTPRPSLDDGSRHAWHLYIIMADLDKLSIDRDQFMAEMLQENIGIGLHFPAVHLQPYYRETFGCARGQLPKTEYVTDRILSLPLYPGMSEDDVLDTAAAVARVASRNAR